MSKRRVAHALVAVAVLMGVATACLPSPDLYVPSTAGGDPGTVLKAYGQTFDGLDSPYRGRSVQYVSTSTSGEPNVVTGSLYTAKAPWAGPGPRPIIGFAPGTQGLGDRCAPSQSLPRGTSYEQGVIAALLDKGWAVAVTDYEGLGTPGDHTYTIRDAGAHAILDLVRAAYDVPDAGFSPDAPVTLWGYSLGGQAVGRAGEIAGAYAPEVDLVGVVAGGVPADLGDVATNLNGPGNAFFSFLALSAIGLDTAYPELDLHSYLNDTGRSLLEQAYADGGICLADGLALAAGLSIEELTTTNPLAEPAWQARIEEQRVGTGAPTVPVLQFHGTDDQVVPLAVGTELRDAWCAQGVAVTFREYPVDHLAGVYSGTADGIAFVDSLASGGTPPAPTC